MFVAFLYSLSIVLLILSHLIHTHYHNSNLIWRTVSRRVDEVIPFLILKPVLFFHPETLRELLPHNVTFLDVTSSCFPSLVPCLQFTLRNVAAKAGNRRQPRFKG